MSRLPDDRRAVFTDIYKFYEEHWDMENTPENWKKCCEEQAKIIEKHGYSNLAKQLAFACYDAINDDAKEEYLNARKEES